MSKDVRMNRKAEEKLFFSALKAKIPEFFMNTRRREYLRATLMQLILYLNKKTGNELLNKKIVEE